MIFEEIPLQSSLCCRFGDGHVHGEEIVPHRSRIVENAVLNEVKSLQEDEENIAEPEEYENL